MNTIAVVQDQCCITVTLKLLIMSTNMERKLVKLLCDVSKTYVL